MKDVHDYEVIQELTLTKLVQQNERIIHLVHEQPVDHPYLYTDPGMSHHQHQLDHHTQFPFQPTALFISPTTLATNDSTTPETQPNQRRAFFPVPDYNQHPLFVDLDNKFQHIPAQHRISGSTLVAEFNSFAGPGNFAKHLTEQLFQSFLLKSVSVGFILTMVTRGTTKINWIHHVSSLWKSMPHTSSQK